MEGKKIGKLFIKTILTTVMILAAGQVFAGSDAKQNPSRIIMIIALMDFTDQEYYEPRKVFEKAGATVKVASTTTQTAISHALAKVRVDQAIADIKLDQADAIVVVGGMG